MQTNFSPEQRADPKIAEAEAILRKCYIFSPIAIEPSRKLVSTKVKGWSSSAAGYNNSQFLTLE